MITKLRLVFAITIAFLSFSGYAQDRFWQQDFSQTNLNQNFSKRFDVQKGKVFSFDEKRFKNELKTISVAKGNATVVYFPDEQGKAIAFQVTESPVFSAALSRKYPNIKSYKGFALNGSNDKIRFSVSQKGVQSMIVHSDEQRSTFMQKDEGNKYVVYVRDPNAKRNKDFICSTKGSLEGKTEPRFSKTINDQVLRKFRLAVSASGEYTQYHGGTVEDALAAINATVTRINEVFETDLAIQLEVIAATDQVIFVDPEEDPYSDSLSPKVQAELTRIIGEANYDLGILFNRAIGDGNAGAIGSVCKDGIKGRAYASTQNPEGDLFDLDFVAHEIGHQFGANHTWSFESEGTGVQVEPGSGTTIMGYAGITGINNVAENGEDYFHYASIIQIATYLETISCGETIALTNNPPVTNPLGSFSIPIGTAFVLTGEATDADIDDELTYTWEQIDNGIVPQTLFGPSNAIGANFRSLKPTTNPERYFPKLSSVIAGNLTQTSPQIGSAWETVSTIEREMNFAFTVRDNSLNGPQLAVDLVNVFVDNGSGPFVINSQSENVNLSAGSIEEIIWDVANTDKAPVNAQRVDIFLSTDGGVTFPTLLAENVSNDGSQMVQIPAIPTTEARIMVKAHNNIFFAVNSADFNIQESEIILNFTELEYEVCRSENLVVPFTYQTFLGFNEEASFSIVSPPSGVDIAISPETATATDSAIDITFTNTENLTVGTYPIRLLATTASITKEVIFDLKVYDLNFSAIALSMPEDGTIDVSARTALEWQANDLATFYDVEIASDVAFTSIIETGQVIGNSFSPLNLENLETYFWRVKPNNSCGEGIYGTPFSFTTIDFNCTTKEDAALPQVISPSGTPTVISKIPIFDDLLISDINVNLEIDHSFVSDLVVTLTSPSGTVVPLISNSCEDFDNINATFDDEGVDFICDGDPVISGIVKPLGFLSSFIGESTFGEWILTVSDNAPSDGGALVALSLEICAEGEFRPDEDNDGVFDDGPDLCLGTPKGSQVDTSGCPILVVPASNYRLEAQSESCRSSNDGSIVISVIEDLDYSVSISGNGANSTENFTDSIFTLTNLTGGTYTICITATDGNLISSEQCFDVVIDEPELLAVSLQTSLDGSVVDLQLNGSTNYNIELNGVVSQTANERLSLNLKPGFNTLKITTNLSCQGVYEERFLFSQDLLVYPNPFDDVVKLFFGNTVQEVRVFVFDDTGSLVLKDAIIVNQTELELDLSSLATGLYFIQYETNNQRGTTKVMKR